MDIKKSFINFVSDKNGKVVLVQYPNFPIIAWFMSLLAAHFVPAGFVKNGLISLSGAFLFLWAYLEITQGASLFRRLLGAVVLSAVIVTYFA